MAKRYINQFQNREKEYDGNPIFSAFIPEVKKAICIIQVSPEEDGSELSAWTGDIELENNTAELVSDLKLTPKAKSQARILIEQWIKGDLSASMLEEILQAVA